MPKAMMAAIGAVLMLVGGMLAHFTQTSNGIRIEDVRFKGAAGNRASTGTGSDEALARQLFNYGVGFTAILTKALFTDRRFAASVARSLPVAMRLRRRRAACGELPAALPPHLVKLQREGMLRGPWLYLKSRRWARRLDLDAVIAGN